MTTFEKLYTEVHFVNFCRLLHEFAQRYTVIIVASDTPCGAPDFTSEVAAEFMNIGLKIPLHDKSHCSYVAIIHEGQTLFENISSDNVVAVDFELNDHKFIVCSRNSNLRTPGEPLSCITINENMYRCDRGLTFIIWDGSCNDIIYFTRFDTYKSLNKEDGGSDNYKFAAIYLKKKYPNRRLLTVNRIEFPTENRSVNESLNAHQWNKLTKLSSSGNAPGGFAQLHYKFFHDNKSFPWFALNEYIDNTEDMLEILKPPDSYIATDGARRLYDYCGKYLNIASGHRITPGNPVNASRTIWVIGGCSAFGIGARDVGTIATSLQTILNDNASELGFSVQNYGYFFWNTNIFTEVVAIYESLPIGANDIVIIQMVPGFKSDIDVSKLGKRPHNYGELFWDISHHTENANRLMGEKIFEHLKENNFYIDSIAQNNTLALQDPSIKRDYGFSQPQLEQLEAYKQNLCNFYSNNLTDVHKVGAIVMNCNPFTLGHRYLIELAAKKVDFLVVFIVQEDKSFFPFADRIDLVDKGTSHLPNVGITASGQFIISTLTFTEYFNKKKLQDRMVDSSMDVTLFAREIAPCMHISVRFAGSEPFDKVTKQYNDTLKAILPRYGIEFEEIPRIEQDGEAISASRVRALLKNKDFEAISKLVPKTTLEYLVKHYG